MNKQNYRTCIGGILILAACIITIMGSLFSMLLTFVQFGSTSHIGPIIVSNLITLGTNLLFNAPVIVMCVMMMMKKWGAPITVTAFIAAAFSLISFVLTLISNLKAGGSVNWLQNLLCIAAFAALAVLSLMAANPQPHVFKKLWFLPGVLYGIFCILSIVNQIKFNLSLGVDYVTAAGIGYLVGLVIGMVPKFALYTVGMVLAGQWIANPYKKGYQPQPQYDEQTMQALNYYKWQYESGAITWEQYNAAIQPYMAQYNK
jgi:hypothetical protein